MNAVQSTATRAADVVFHAGAKVAWALPTRLERLVAVLAAVFVAAVAVFVTVSGTVVTQGVLIVGYVCIIAACTVAGASRLKDAFKR